MSQRRIAIAVPTYSGDVNGHTMLSLMRAVDEGRSAGWVIEVAMRPLDSLLVRARNAMLSDFMNGTADDLLFWDADVACGPGAFTRLMAHDVDCVAGAYPARCDPEHYIFRDLPGGPAAPDPRTGLLEKAGTCAGFLRITRFAIQRMIDHFPDLWVKERDGTRLHWLFDNELVDHEYWGEDLTFCKRLRAAGGRVWLDPELPLHHTGPKAFSGQYSAFLRRLANANTTPAELAAEQDRLDAVLAT